MSTTENFNVYKGLPYLIKARASGKWDYTASQTFTTEGQAVNVSMAAYDGLSETYEESWQSADKVDFSNTVLPWKWQYSTALSTNRYCLMPVNGGQDVTKEFLSPDITKVGSPTISSDFIVSGFSTSNYLTTSNPSIVGFEANHSTRYFQFTTGSSVTGDPCFEGQVSIYIESSYVKTWDTNTSSGVSLFPCTGNTDYWVKVVINGTSRTYYYKTTNTDWTQCYQSSDFEETTGSQVIIPTIGYASWPAGFTGTIDLKELKVADSNDNVVWKAVDSVIEHNMYENITELDYAYNFDVVGSPTIDNQTEVVSGFSLSNYLQLQNAFNPGNNPWEVQLKFIRSTSNNEGLFQSSKNLTGGYFGIGLNIIDNKFDWGVAANDSSWIFVSSSSSTYTVLANKVYYVRFGWTGTEYYLKYMNVTDGETEFTTDFTYQSTSPVTNSIQTTALGMWCWGSGDSGRYLDGSIDLSESYIKINGQDWWVPEFTKRAKQQLSPDITKVGSPTISSDFVASGFSSSNYLTVNKSASNSTTIIKFKTPSLTPSSGALHMILEGRPAISQGTNTIHTWNALAGQLVTLFTVENNQVYWVKTVNNSSNVTIYYKKDGESWTQCYYGHFNSDENEIETLGYTSNQTYFSGEIYLSETKLLDSNENVIWSGINPVTETLAGCTYNFTDDGSATTLNCFAVNGDESVVLTPDNSYGTSRLLGTVSIPAHTVYTYNNGVWTEVSE